VVNRLVLSCYWDFGFVWDLVVFGFGVYTEGV